MQQQSFSSKYIYLKKLGQGGCGNVYLAENINLGNLWAVKEIPKARETSISRYIEPEILKRLNHPALPRICDVYEDETNFYIVEDYLEGQCLKQELDRKGKFTEPQVLDWAIQLCSVLDYLHKQKPYPIIYGDLKPQNIILTRDGFIKLIDFGVSTLLTDAKRYAPPEYEQNTSFIGTKGYAAPEQFLVGKSSCRSDIYALGITMLQLLTGRDPVKTADFLTHESYAEVLPCGLWDILKRCIAINPDMRYQSAEELLKDLRQYSLSSIAGISESVRNPYPASFTKMIAVTGIRSTGVSTITGALAQAVTRDFSTACIVDLSVAGAVKSSLKCGREEHESEEGVDTEEFKLMKINSRLYYVHLSDILKDETLNYTLLNKHLSQLKDKFSYLFLDVDLACISMLESYMNQIFIVSDMNPCNIKKVKSCLEACCTTASQTPKAFVLNKFYKGEVSSSTILKCLLLDKDAPESMHALVNSMKIYEIPYDEKIYFNWIYSFLGQPMKFSGEDKEPFNQAVTKVVHGSIQSQGRRLNFKKQIARFLSRRI